MFHLFTQQTTGLGVLYVNFSSASTPYFYGYDDPLSQYYNNTGTYGATYQLQALAPATGCTAQRILISNSTLYGTTTQVSVFNAAAGPGWPKDGACVGNVGPSPSILMGDSAEVQAAGATVPVVTGNTILVLGKGFAYGSTASIYM